MWRYGFLEVTIDVRILPVTEDKNIQSKLSIIVGTILHSLICRPHPAFQCAPLKGWVELGDEATVYWHVVCWAYLSCAPVGMRPCSISSAD